MPSSKLKVEIARMLLDEGYVEAFAVARGEEAYRRADGHVEVR